jgi:hypothetical protein
VALRRPQLQRPTNRNSILAGLLLLVGAAAFAGLFIVLLVWPTRVLIRKYEARRSRQIQAVLSSPGFTLQEERNELYLRYVGLFKIGQRGESRKISNHFESIPHVAGITHLMDYSFEEGSGKGGRLFRQTLAIISNKRYELPSFVLAPENSSRGSRRGSGRRTSTSPTTRGSAGRSNCRGRRSRGARSLHAGGNRRIRTPSGHHGGRLRRKPAHLPL